MELAPARARYIWPPGGTRQLIAVNLLLFLLCFFFWLSYWACSTFSWSMNGLNLVLWNMLPHVCVMFKATSKHFGLVGWEGKWDVGFPTVIVLLTLLTLWGMVMLCNKSIYLSKITHRSNIVSFLPLLGLQNAIASLIPYVRLKPLNLLTSYSPPTHTFTGI